MPFSFPDGSSSQAGSGQTRLDGWKEIAAYLGRGERTVKRWERDRGLPTHRVPGSGRATVYAFSSELDEWLKSRKAQGLDAAEDDEEPASLEAPTPLPSGPVRNQAAGQVADQAAAQPVGMVSATKDSVDMDLVSAPHRLKAGWKGALVAALAAVLVAALYVTVLRPVHGGIRHRVLALLGNAEPAARKPSFAAVSDAEKAQAHDLYLGGRYEWSQRTPDSLNRALDDFVQAVVHDPGSAQAYAGMADTYDLLREYSTMPESDAFPRAIAAARKAVELDDSLAEAHRALAFAEFYGSWDFRDAEAEFRRAIELNPADPIARRWYANAFAVPGRFPQSLEQIDKAQELDPTSQATLSDKGFLLARAGKSEEGMALLKKVELTDPAFFSPHFFLMVLSLERRDYPTYLDEGQKAAEIMNDPVLKDIVAAARAGYTHAGEQGLWRELYARQRHYYADGKLWATMLAKTCILMGKRQESLDLLEEAYARHEEYLLSSISAPDFLTLSNEPRYKALVKKINFPAAPSSAAP